MIGFAASACCRRGPARSFGRISWREREGLPPTACFATIILERLLDLVTVLLLFGVFVVLVDPASLSGDPALYARVKAGGLLAAAARVAGLVVLFVLAGHPERLGVVGAASSGCCRRSWRGSVAGLVENFAQGLARSCGGRGVCWSRWRCRFRCGSRLRWASGSRHARFI